MGQAGGMGFGKEVRQCRIVHQQHPVGTARDQIGQILLGNPVAQEDGGEGDIARIGQAPPPGQQFVGNAQHPPVGLLGQDPYAGMRHLTAPPSRR